MMRLLGNCARSLQVKVRFGNRPHHRHGVHLLGVGVGQSQAGGDGVLRHLVEPAPVGAPAHQLRFFDGGEQLAVFQNGGGRIAQQAADSEDDHFFGGAPFLDLGPRVLAAPPCG